MKRSVRRFTRLGLGILSLSVGLAGLFLPILQGWLFLGIGALLLSPEIPIFERLLRYIEGKYPSIGRRMHGFRLKYLEKE